MELYNNGGFNNFAQPTMGTGYQWNPNPAQQTKQMNVLTADEIQTLMKQENKFTLALTQTEKLKAACNHRRADGLGDSLVENADGTVSCQICGYTFKPVDPATSGEDYLNAAVAEIVDILQTVKMLWIDVDPQVLREYSQVLPLIEKLPQLYQIAVKNYSNHENYNSWAYAGKNMSTLQMFGLLNGMLNGIGQPNQQQFQAAPQNAMPGYGYGYQQPMYGQPQQPGFNPFAAQGYQPQAQGFAYQPGMAAPQQPVADPSAAAGQPVAEATTTDGATNTTTAQFKA